MGREVKGKGIERPSFLPTCPTLDALFSLTATAVAAPSPVEAFNSAETVPKICTDDRQDDQAPTFLGFRVGCGYRSCLSFPSSRRPGRRGFCWGCGRQTRRGSISFCREFILFAKKSLHFCLKLSSTFVDNGNIHHNHHH